MPLLRTVSLSGGKEGMMVTKTFNNIQYMRVHRKQFSTLEILITDDTGKKVAFQRGKTLVTLHFRQQKPAYF